MSDIIGVSVKSVDFDKLDRGQVVQVKLDSGEILHIATVLGTTFEDDMMCRPLIVSTTNGGGWSSNQSISAKLNTGFCFKRNDGGFTTDRITDIVIVN